MKNNKFLKPNFLFILGLVLLFSNCKRDRSDDAEIATFPKNGLVYIDGFSAGLEYLPFGGSFFEAFTVDDENKYKGTSAMRFDVPNVGDPNGAYAGAIFPDYGGRDLSDFDALTFWAKATTTGTINEIGFGQDFRENKYLVTLNNLELTTNWRQYTIAIPDPSRLTQERGLFWYAEGPEDGEGYTFWIDELQFEKLGTIAQPRPSILEGQDLAIPTFIGVTTTIANLQQTLNLGNGLDQTINVAPSYFEFTSSDPDIATVNEQGVITAVSTGNAVITATLNGIDAKGSARVSVSGAFDTAPVPTQDPNDVISIFSDAYTNEPVDYYNGYWAPFQTTLGQNDINIGGDNLIAYTELNFVGIQFAVDAPTINAAAMTHFHLDVQAREAVEAGDFFTVRVVDAGSDNQLGTADDSSGEITLNNGALTNGEWYSLDIPLSDLAGLSSRNNLAQIIFVTDATITSAYLDNIYFYNDGGMTGPSGPTMAAPAPMQNSADVISIFSDAYDNLGSNLNPGWGQATQVSEVNIAGNNTLRYGGLNFQGLELDNSQDVSTMEFLHIDYWTENSTALNAFLISNGPVETAKALSVPTSGWASIDIPLGDFSPVDLADLIQFKFDGSGDIYLDNIYFYKTGGSVGMEPTTAAPTPMEDAANVVSIFSDAYDNLGSNLNPGWGQATQVSEVSIAGNNTLRYGGLNFQGLELDNSQDVSDMEFLHIDYWTANSSALNAFIISNGPVETAKALSVPTSGWASVDIPLGDFSPVDLADLIQFKFDGDGDIYLDNIYFYKMGGSGGTEPTAAAPAPSQNAADVISLFSDEYTNVTVDTWRTEWSAATLEDIQVQGNDTKKYTDLDFVGVETVGGNVIDASSMTHFRIDIWTPNMTTFRIKLVDFGPNGAFDGGDDTEHELVFENPTQGQWVSYDIPLSDFTGLASSVHMAQYILSGLPSGGGTIYVDNVYFYKQ